MRKTPGILWALIAFCFLALIACAHAPDREPADASQGVRSGTTTSGDSPAETNLLNRNHGGGRSTNMNYLPKPGALPRLANPAVASLSTGAPFLAGFAPVTTNSAISSNAQPSYGWFLFAVALLFALIYAVRRSNARPDEQEPQIK